MRKPTISNHPPMRQDGNVDDVEFASWISNIESRFNRIAQQHIGILFTTDVADLFAVYLKNLPAEQRQYHTCHECRRFLNTYGSIVTIDPSTFQHEPVMWAVEEAPEFYRPAVAAMIRAIKRAHVTGVFFSDKKAYGTFRTGAWTHFAVTPAPDFVFTSKLETPDQAAAKTLEKYRMLQRAIHETLPSTVAAARTLLEGGLYRSERVHDQIIWFHELHGTVKRVARGQRANAVWHAAVTAPPGHCHIRSSVAGTLLDDIAKGLPQDVVKARFAEKMRADKYMRPVAAPSEQNIKRGEDIIEKLGLTASLRRRYATLDDVAVAVWREPMPAEKTAPRAPGVFSHLKKPSQPQSTQYVSEQTMTWEKFARTVLPNAQRVEFLVPNGRTSFGALVTASDHRAPPILQWDNKAQRNPVSFYVWTHGSPASQWGLTPGEWRRVPIITLSPSMWHGDYPHQGRGVLFVLDGAKESQTQCGLALFPSTLKAELHEIRSTIEAFSKAGTLEGSHGPMACGFIASDGSSNWTNVVVRVTTSFGQTIYKLDRWD